jgi:hypothetical protein
MNSKILLAGLFLIGILALPSPAAADTLACTPATFVPKPVPGGIIGDTWDTVGFTYNSSPAAGACVPGADTLAGIALGAANTACNVLIGENCPVPNPNLTCNRVGPASYCVLGGSLSHGCVAVDPYVLVYLSTGYCGSQPNSVSGVCITVLGCLEGRGGQLCYGNGPCFP